MPFSDAELHLWRILESIAFGEEFTSKMDFATYQADQKTRSVTERQMQILTEAAFRLGDEAEVICNEVDWRRIRGLGNRLRHGYDRLSDHVIWNTIQLDLHPLKTAVVVALLRLQKPEPTGL